MVPIPPTSLVRRAGAGDRNAASTGELFMRKRNPLITYGKKDTKPLSLTANQFRRDVYSIPTDAEDEDSEIVQTKASLARAGVKAVLQAAEDSESVSESESGLSDEPEPERSMHFAAAEQSGLRSAGANARRPIVVTSTTTNTSFAPTSSATTKKGTAKPVKTPLPKPVYPSESPPTPKVVKRKAKPKTTEQRVTRPARRLPVNELMLVLSPPNQIDFGPPQSSQPGIQTQDPINDHPSSARKRSLSPIDSEDEANRKRPAKQPLSVFRRRIRSNKFRYKPLSDLRKKRSVHSPTDGTPSKSGDGFDAPELFISPLVRKAVRRKRPRHDHLISEFSALQLQSGPLPDVEFEQTSTSLKMEANAASVDSQDGVVQANPDIGAESQRSMRRVSFHDQAREDAIMAQLSSISAPARPRAEDSDNSDDENEDEDEGAERDEDVIADGFEAIPEDDVYEADTEVEEDLDGRQDEEVERIDAGAVDGSPAAVNKPTLNKGVSLDFRSTVPGRRPRRRIRQDTLMEVDDNIVEVADADFPSTQQALPTITNYQFQVSAHESASEVRGCQTSPTKRPRSILKNTSQAVSEGTTHAQQTAANTRRNSTIELSESRYFTDAADMLLHADPATHKIVPRRQRSTYYDEIEIPYSGAAVVPETSPSPEAEMLDYPQGGDLGVLRRTSEAEWTSQSLPAQAAAPRDLRTLTRSVSRGYGTLSQETRRRQSLPFQSPTKIR